MIDKWTLGPEVSRFQTGALTSMEPGPWGRHQVSALQPMCQIMFYNQLPTFATIDKWTLGLKVGQFHTGALTDPGPRGEHKVSDHGANVSNHVLLSIANFCHH